LTAGLTGLSGSLAESLPIVVYQHGHGPEGARSLKGAEMTHTRVVCGLIGLAVFGIAGAGEGAAAADDPWYRVSEQVEGHTYAYWNAAWARFEWEPGGAKSPLLHPQGCNHATVGRVVFLPGPAKGQTISCSLPGGVSVLVPTSSGIYVRTSKKDTAAGLRRAANSTFADTKVLDVSLDGKKINARQFKNTTGLFLLRLEKGSPIGLTGSRAAAQAGYNFLLRPLSAGPHTITMHIKSAHGGKTLYEARTTFKLKIGAS
jgi:hypothetical protein